LEAKIKDFISKQLDPAITKSADAAAKGSHSDAEVTDLLVRITALFYGFNLEKNKRGM